MKKKKSFDCIDMKARIQAQLLGETESLGEDEAQRVQWERALRSPVLGEFIKRLQEKQPTRAL